MNKDFWAKVALEWSIISGKLAEEVGDVEEVLTMVKKMANEQHNFIRQIEDEDDFLLGVDDEW